LWVDRAILFRNNRNQVIVESQPSEADVQRLRIELRRAESHARSLRRRLEDLGGVRRHGRRSLTEEILEFLDRDPTLEFSPADVRDGISVDGDVSSILRSLARQGRVVRAQRGIYRSIRACEENATE